MCLIRISIGKRMKIARIKEFSFSLRRVVTACACCMFLASVLFPFLTVPYYSIIPEDAYCVTYWSYKATIKYLKLGYEMKSETLFFSTYWFAKEKPYSYPTPSNLGVSWVLVPMFLAQILTLGLGFAALFGHRKRTQFFPLISCFSVTILMVYMIVQTRTLTFARALKGFELGFWISVLSAVLFLYAFILHGRHVD